MASTDHSNIGSPPNYSGVPGPQPAMSSQYPEVITHSTLPEAVPVYDQKQYYEQPYDQPHQQQQYHQQQWAQQQQPSSDVSSNTYPESQAGWTSVSQRGLDQVASEPGAHGEKASAEPAPHKMILGLRRRKFWLIIGPLLLILVIGLAVGLGVGLSSRSSGSAAAAATTTAPPPAPTPVVCPAGNGTLYTQSAADGGASFLIVCNVDYNGNDPSSGTTDLTSTACTSTEECMTICAENKDCAGAWFGDFYGQQCFLKSSLGKSNVSKNSVFVIKQKS